MRNDIRSCRVQRIASARIRPGVRVEGAAHASRVRRLEKIDAEARFIPIKPFPGPIDETDLRDTAQAGAGGGRDPGSRPVQAGRARQIRNTRDRDDAAFLLKRWRGVRREGGGRLLDGEEPNGFPWPVVPEPRAPRMYRSRRAENGLDPGVTA